MDKTEKQKEFAEKLTDIVSCSANQQELTRKLSEFRNQIKQNRSEKEIFDYTLERVRKIFDGGMNELYGNMRLEFYYDFDDFASTQDPYIEIISQKDEFCREQAVSRISNNAKRVGFAKFSVVLRKFICRDPDIDSEDRRKFKGNVEISMNAEGKPETTIDNFVRVLENDSYFSGKITYNMLKSAPESVKDGKTARWEDCNDADARYYIEKMYGIHSMTKYDDAMRIVFENHRYHPVRDFITALEWDGKERISSFLTHCAGCEDTAYNREVSRLIFAGGIQRAFNAGIKFDCVPVLVGKQGAGKSTLVQMLAVNPEWYGEIKEIEGSKGIEDLEGVWIAEFSEMLGLVRAKDCEAQKAFITRQVDKYRKPYDKRVTEYPRQNIFIGTSNKARFITDKTGGRRYFPVEVHQTGRELIEHKEEYLEFIKQCWAESYARINTDFMRPVEDYDLMDVIREMQENAMEDDYRTGMIDEFLESKTETCVIEIWYEALHMPENSRPSKKESNEIALIMERFREWKRQSNPKTFPNYGRQKWWAKEQNTPSLIP